MAAVAKRVVSQVTDVVFPVSKSALDLQHQRLFKIGNEYKTNLPLQMLLYFNSLFYPFWLFSTIMILDVKYAILDTLYRIILISVLIMMTLVELIRLYLGFMGNLVEKVPELAGFWLLTVLLQFPLILFLLFNEHAIILPLERAMHCVLAVFVSLEVVTGYFAIRSMVNYQVTKFHIQQFTEMDKIPSTDVLEEPWARKLSNECSENMCGKGMRYSQ